MDSKDFISVSDFCKGHRVASHFIMELHEVGLLEVEIREDVRCIPLRELPKAERILRLHSDLDINLEGIEVITQLLNRVEAMQKEMTQLKNRLGLYE